MNKVILMGRLTRDPDVRYSQGDTPMAVARYTLAVDRRFKRDNDQQTADFIGCVAFGRQGEFAEKYFRKGLKIAVTGRIQTGSYTNQSWWRIRNLRRARLPATVITMAAASSRERTAITTAGSRQLGSQRPMRQSGTGL